MSVKCKDIIEIMNLLAPLELAEEWDNCGLSIGSPDYEVKKILLALDVIEPVIQEAIALNADMIITHHPLILFQKIKNVTTQTHLGNNIIQLIQNKISVFSAHTNLDVAFGGTNDVLAHLAGLKNIHILEETFQDKNGKSYGIGRIGTLLEEMRFDDFAKMIKKQLNLDCMRIVGDLNKKIKTVALCTGSGFEYMMKAKKENADVYITADLKFHEAQKAIEEKLCLIDATHYASENIIVPVLKEYIEKEAKKRDYKIQVYCSSINGQTFQTI